MRLKPVALISTAVVILSYSPSSSVQAFSIRPLNSSTSDKTSMTTTASTASIQGSIELQNSWIAQLSPETPENLQKSRQIENLSDLDDNRRRRPVFNGHYVLVKPTGLSDPRLIVASSDVAENLLGLTSEQVQSDEFLQLVSGNGVLGDTWATPYALSIMGTRYTNNCPYGTGNGYGDGRAISIGEWNNYELQLKGAGKTPFARGADGRAVLRSSIREFLASESMWHLGVRTTRGLSLVVSQTDTILRPWYSEGAKLELPSEDDPRLARYSPEERRAILAQLRHEKVDPNVMIEEAAAIACRVCSSFTRVGHFDLLARRVEKSSQENFESTNKRYDTSTREYEELEQLVWHACYREFRDEAYTPFIADKDVASAATVLLERSADRLAEMVSQWIRVGFAQGNFNADNCLIGGHTMDYGPFGFLEEYNPYFAKWTGSGRHFGFMNQPSAGFVNYQVLVESVVPVICAARSLDDPETLVNEFMTKAQPLFEGKVAQVFRRKLGFKPDVEVADELWETLQTLLMTTRVDWTLFWRQLTLVASKFDDYTSDNFEAMLEVLIGDGNSSPFYETLSEDNRQHYLQWIKRWRALVSTQPQVAERMRLANPKYVLREWMLVEAYSQAARGNETELHDLFALIQHPYDGGSSEQESKYYRRTPEEAHMAGGTAFMS